MAHQEKWIEMGVRNDLECMQQHLFLTVKVYKTSQQQTAVTTYNHFKNKE
jgi:hypothetical protein